MERRLPLSFKELVYDYSRDPEDRDRREHEESSKENFESKEHIRILPNLELREERNTGDESNDEHNAAHAQRGSGDKALALGST